jgi:filamentous hemagglutinin family protein
MKIVIKLSIYLTLSCNATAYAEVVTDGSVGGKGFIGVPQTLDAVDKITTTVSQDMGTTAGTNLFHSFKFFNINSGETVRFEGDKNLTNVISRVTGGHISTIDGTLNSTIGTANFYFINPAGVMFGAHARVNVPAAFHVSTADSLRFSDGNEFSATNPSASTLTIAEPASFGFLGNSISHIVSS